jgi:lysophospholipase L1-like esterase
MNASNANGWLRAACSVVAPRWRAGYIASRVALLPLLLAGVCWLLSGGAAPAFASEAAEGEGPSAEIGPALATLPEPREEPEKVGPYTMTPVSSGNAEKRPGLQFEEEFHPHSFYGEEETCAGPDEPCDGEGEAGEVDALESPDGPLLFTAYHYAGHPPPGNPDAEQADASANSYAWPGMSLTGFDVEYQLGASGFYDVNSTVYPLGFEEHEIQERVIELPKGTEAFSMYVFLAGALKYPEPGESAGPALSLEAESLPEGEGEAKSAARRRARRGAVSLAPGALASRARRAESSRDSDAAEGWTACSAMEASAFPPNPASAFLQHSLPLFDCFFEEELDRYVGGAGREIKGAWRKIKIIIGSALAAAGPIILHLISKASTYFTDPEVSAPKNYVAMGDSQAAGLGLDPPYVETDGVTPEPRLEGDEDVVDGCYRSGSQSYPALLHKGVLKNLEDLDFKFVACSGVPISALTTQAAEAWGPSMNGAFGPDNYDAPKKSAVVTLSFGGNDVGFFQGVTLCVLLGCQQAIQRAEKEVKEETEGGGPARFGAILHVEENIKRVREDLRNIFKEIPEYALRGNVTTEKVFVVGYAPVFPLEPDVAKGCQGANNMNPTKAAESLPLLAKWEEEMQTAIEGAVEEAKSGFTAPSEIKFVDTSGPFKDHDVCQPKGERWIFGREGKLREGRTKVGLWHPNAEGAKAMAEALEKAGIAKAATEPFSRRARDGASRLARRSSRAAGARTAVSRPVRARAESVGRVVSAGRARAASSAGLSARAVFPFESMSAEPLSLGTLSGTVTDAITGSPIEGVCVYADSRDGGSGYGSATTASDGTYTIVGLATGSYVVEFSPCEGSSTNYLTQFYDDATDEASATAVSVTAGGGTVGIDAALQQSATFWGTVTDAVTGEPIEGVCVYADPSDGGSGSGAATTASDGTYTIDTGLAAGSYEVEFDPCEGSGSSYVKQFYDGATSESSAKAVNVTAGASTESIDAALQKAGTISGSVSEAAGGSPLARVCVRAFSSDGTVQSPISVTSSTGTYTVADLPAGSYDVYFDPTCQGAESSAFLAQWSGGASKLGSATAVSVTAGGEATGVNAALVKPASVYGSISGTVTGAASGKPLASVCVTAISSGEGEGSGFAETAADGTYTITGLPAHGYYLDVDPSCGSETNQSGYVAQWSGGASSQQSASVVSVTAGATTSANTALEKSGSISGTVIDAASGKPIEGVCVTTWPGGEDEAVTTAASGTYTIEGLTPGTYYVEFDPTCPGSSNQNDLAQWYDGASEEDANAVTVTAGAATANINASLQTEGPTPGCTGDTGTIKLSPGMTNTAAVQTMEIKGALTGCTDAPFTGASYTATLHSATAVSCSALNAGGEIASGSSSYKWTPKTKPSKATGTLSVPLSETPGVELSGTVAAGPHSPLELSGTLTERYTGGATCGVREGKKAAKPVKKGTFTGSAVRF